MNTGPASLRLVFAGRTLWRNRRQSLLALLAIGSSVFVLTTLIGLRALLMRAGVFSSFLPLRRMAAAPVRAGLAQR